MNQIQINPADITHTRHIIILPLGEEDMNQIHLYEDLRAKTGDPTAELSMFLIIHRINGIGKYFEYKIYTAHGQNGKMAHFVQGGCCNNGPANALALAEHKSWPKLPTLTTKTIPHPYAHECPAGYTGRSVYNLVREIPGVGQITHSRWTHGQRLECSELPADIGNSLAEVFGDYPFTILDGIITWMDPDAPGSPTYNIFHTRDGHDLR